MSWYGSHPVITKAEARKLLHPAACKRCVYYARVYPDEGLARCARCGNRGGARLYPLGKYWHMPYTQNGMELTRHYAQLYLSGRTPQTDNQHVIERRPVRKEAFGGPFFPSVHFQYFWTCRCGATLFARGVNEDEALMQVLQQEHDHLARAVPNVRSR